MSKITFLGATGTVTGSRFLLEIKGEKILIDCGLFQGLKEHRLKNWEPFPYPAQQVKRIFLTHAHIDHTGYLPRFCKEGFSGHPDSNEILAWLMGFNRPPEKTFIVHGEPDSSAAVAERIRQKFNWEVVVPEFGQSFELDL